MSGGQWNYCQWQIEEGLTVIADDPRVKKRWPALTAIWVKQPARD